MCSDTREKGTSRVRKRRYNTYKFLGVFENTKKEDKQELKAAAKTYLQRLSIIWSSPLSDHAKVVASNQYALPVLT